MPNSLGVFLTCDTKATTTATATATATPAALSQLLLLLLLLERWESTALETDKAHWVWGIKNESGRKWNIIGILETLEGPKQLRVSEMRERRRGRGRGRVSGEFIAINRFRVAVGRDRQLIKNSAAIATIEWNLRWQHTHTTFWQWACRALGVAGASFEFHSQRHKLSASQSASSNQ